MRIQLIRLVQIFSVIKLFLSSINETKLKSIELSIEYKSSENNYTTPFIQGDNFCFGNQCLDTLIDFYGNYSFITSRDVKNCNFSYMYDSESSTTYKKIDPILQNNDDLFKYYKAVETLNFAKNKKIENIPFVHITEQKMCDSELFHAKFGLGFGTIFLKKLKILDLIDSEILSLVPVSYGKSKILIGDIFEELRNETDVATCQNIENLSGTNCEANMNINTEKFNVKHSQFDILSFNTNREKVLFDDEIFFEYPNGEINSYFTWFKDYYFKNDKMCTYIPNSLYGITCNIAFMKKLFWLPNILVVVNNNTIVLKPLDLFEVGSDNKMYFKGVFAYGNQKIVFTHRYLMNKNISLIYNHENKNLWLSGFKTHQYGGETDVGYGYTAPEETSGYIDIGITIVCLILICVASYFYFCKKKVRNDKQKSKLLKKR